MFRKVRRKREQERSDDGEVSERSGATPEMARWRPQGSQDQVGQVDAVRSAALGLQAKLLAGGTNDAVEAPSERVQRRDARSITADRVGSETVRRDGDETAESASATPPNFAQPVTAAQVAAFPLRAAQQMKNSDEVCKNVHETAFASSWSRAKHALIGNPDTEKVMEQLLVFRQRSHDRVFAKTMLKLEEEQAKEGGLTSASAAGSQTLSSDIDANLKGTSTEKAVAIFNDIFSREEHWGMESGVVFDINVYALDFMHGTSDAGGQGLQALAEGGRAGAAAGGVASMMDADADIVGADLVEQRSWALVKVRHYTTLKAWGAHCDTSGTPQHLSAIAQDRHLAYYREVTHKMAALAGINPENLGPEARALVDEPNPKVTPQVSLERVAAALVAGQVDGDVKKEQLMLSSANRIYEEKLTEVAQIRKDLEGALAQHELAWSHPTGTEIADAERNVEIHLTLLRDKISEGNLFANEAYLTDGAVNHAVQGLQIGKKIRQTMAQGGDAITENMADALKEIHRHGKNGSLGEAAFKSGKYLFRLADAAKNAGITDDLVMRTYALGDEISNRIKKTDYSKPGVERPEGDGDPHELASALEVEKQYSDKIKTPEDLAAKVQEVGGLAMSLIAAFDPEALGSPVLKPPKREGL